MAANTRSAEIAAIRERLGLSIPKFAERLGVKMSQLNNWVYGKSNAVPDDVIVRARAMLGTHDVGPPKIPASQLLIPVPFIGGVSASSPIDWTDPFEAETFEYVPPEMGDAKGRFACSIVGDSMFELLEQGDVCVFQSEAAPKIGLVVLFRSDDRRVTVKTLKHDGTRFVLSPVNPAYEPVEAKGICVGYLVGIIRQIGSKRVTVYDPTGIRP